MVKSNARITEIKNGSITRTTAEHPYYSKQRFNDGYARRYFGKPEWTCASGLTKDNFLALPMPESSEDDSHSEQFWYVVGRYLGDGWRTTSNGKGRVVICTSREDSDVLEQRLRDAGFNPCKSIEKTCNKFHITRRWFYEFLEPFGTYAHGKTIPRMVYDLEVSKQRAFMRGYLDADGHREKISYRVSSVSASLAFGIFTLCTKCFGTVPSIRTYRAKRKCVIEGRTCSEKLRYVVEIPDNNKCGFIEDGHGWRQVKTVTETACRETVYNISVDEDESYVANGYVVHNCQPFSQCGQRKADTDERHLFPYIMRGVDACRPELLFFENVEGIISAKLQLEGQPDPVGTPVLLHVLRELERRGYTAAWDLFSAEETGAPHRRNRVFILAYANDARLERYTRHADRSARKGRREIGSTAESRIQSCDVAGSPWPSHPGQLQYDWEPSRTSTYKLGDAPCDKQRGPRLAEQHASSDGLPLGNTSIGVSESCGSTTIERNTQPSVGGNTDGLACGMDYAQLCGACDNRVDELRLLGNGVVPAVAELAFRTLLAELMKIYIDDKGKAC